MSKNNKLYRPANGSEGDWFMNKFCCQCKRSDSNGFCPIIDASMAFEIKDVRYPTQWIIKNPRCTKFVKQ